MSAKRLLYWPLGVRRVAKRAGSCSMRSPAVSQRIPKRCFASQKARPVLAGTTSARGLSLAIAAAICTLALYLAQGTPKSRPDEQPSTDEDQEATGMLSYKEVQKHDSADDCWVIIDGLVYDVTYFLEMHPGGAQAILLHAGKDASETFVMLHPSNALETLLPEACLGPVDPATLPAKEVTLNNDEIRRQSEREKMPPAEDMLVLQDFEDWAERVMSRAAWAYYRSATDEEMAYFENQNAFRRYFFRPRVLKKDMTYGSTETSFVGITTSVSFFISPAAMAKLGHPLGEVNLTKAAGDYGAVQAISANASCSLEEIFAAKREGQPLIYQLYIDKDRNKSDNEVRQAEKLGARAIMFTVDTCWKTKRTLDDRHKLEGRKPGTPSPVAFPSPGTSSPLDKVMNEARPGPQDRNITWDDIAHIRSLTKLPLIVKGVQSVEDVQVCVELGVEGVMLSNHGGRQADYAPPAIDILYEMRCLRPELFDKIDVLLDGGVRSGADVVKALALGAKAVGIGRPFLYANGTHGQEGASRIIEILHQEITTTMRCIGASTIEELKPQMVGPIGPWVGVNRPPYAP